MKKLSNSVFWCGFVIVLIVGMHNLVSSNPKKDSLKVLVDDGYTQVKMTGTGWVGCGKNITYNETFTGINSVGKPVQGRVCGDLYGNYVVKQTVR